MSPRAYEPVSIALLGAGARGELNLATLARKHPDRMRFVAVAEADPKRRASFAERFQIPRKNVFDDYRALLDRPQLADGIVNALPCRLHHVSGTKALELGYQVFLEKPMALTPAECVDLVRTAERNERILMIAVQSRYNTIYQRMRKRLRRGELGRLMAIDCAENIGYWHFVMSYVRGIHRRADLSHSFMLAKGVHDVDLVAWLAGAPAVKVASFGRLSFFNSDNAPNGAPERCTDGCPVEGDCVFSALRQFVNPGRPAIPWRLLKGSSLGAAIDTVRNPRLRTLAAVISEDIRPDAVMKLLRETDHGRCVFRADNDVVDHQTMSVEFENEVMASFQLNGFSLTWERSLDLHGTRGELRSSDFSGRLEQRTYDPARFERQRVPYHGIFHGGGDEKILLAFARAVARGFAGDPTFPSARSCLESHLIGFAAEEARNQGCVVDMTDFRQRVEAAADRLQTTGAASSGDLITES